MIGRTVGPYKIIDSIGSGGMGEVFVGEDMMLERQVAIKLLRPELASRPDVVQRFRSEAVTLAKLQHTNIATVYTFFQEGANFFLVMEYVQGWTLQHILETQGVLAPAVALGLLQQALDGIGFAHQRGIIHRDLKPSNVMLTANGTVKVMDFGLARVLGSAHLTQAGRLVGTLEYISPEQLRGEETDTRSDMYSLGIVLYELVTGCLPFASDSEYALVRAQVETLPPSPRHVMPTLSTDLEQVILRALAKAPQERFHSTKEFSRTLARCTGETDSREALSALLALLKAAPCQAEPAQTPMQDPRYAAHSTPASARIAPTRLANAAGPSITRPVSPGCSQAWKRSLVSLLLLSASVAAAGSLSFLGQPDSRRASTASSRLSGEAIVPSTAPLLVTPQAAAAEALARAAPIGPPERQSESPPFPRGPAPQGQTSRQEPHPVENQALILPGPGNAPAAIEPSITAEIQPSPVGLPLSEEWIARLEPPTIPSQVEDVPGPLPADILPPLEQPHPEQGPGSTEIPTNTPPQKTKGAKKAPRKAPAFKAPRQQEAGHAEQTKNSGGWYIRK